jgi:hypothetical protein
MSGYCPIELFREFWGTQYNVTFRNQKVQIVTKIIRRVDLVFNRK